MPRIPDSVEVLVLVNTTMTNLSQINVNWENITQLHLNNNRNLNTNFLNVPTGIEELHLINQRFMTIRTPSTLQQLNVSFSYIHTLVGHLPRHAINMDHSSNAPLYWSGLRHISSKCDDETDNSWGNIEQIKQKWHIKKLEFIRNMNEAYNHKMYLELGSIKRRIKNPMEHRENPIVAAVFLGSNYLRRAAEFMTEETIA